MSKEEYDKLDRFNQMWLVKRYNRYYSYMTFKKFLEMWVISGK
jgi:hypothetical protein